MKLCKRILTFLLALLILGQVVLMTACKEKPAETTDYTVAVMTEGGSPLEGVGVYIYADATKKELVWFNKTNAEGVAAFSAALGDGYVAVLTDVPTGYAVEDTYPLTGASTEIVLKTALASGDDTSEVVVKLGDVMFDFTVTDTTGKSYTLSELLKTKQAVVLNFWYTSCGPCKAEFPYLQEAYKAYDDSNEVLALNPVDTDSAAVAAFKEQMKLTFPMAVVDKDWERIFSLNAYPTTVVIDRYGVVGLIHAGSIDNAEAFKDIFATYADENYTQTVVDDIDKVTVNGASKTLEFGGVTTFDVTLEPGESVKCHVYKVSGMNLELKNDHAQVIYGDKTYTPKNGKIAFKVTSEGPSVPIEVTIGNTSPKKQTFTVNFTFDKGTLGNPYSLTLGNFTTKVAAGNEQGVYYTYKATKDGTLTLSYLSGTPGVEYGATLYNLNSYAFNTMESDSSQDADGNPCVSVKVKAGQTVQVIVSTLPDESNKYPAGEFKLKATFAAGTVDSGDNDAVKPVDYTIHVKDAKGQAISGAYISVTADGKTTQHPTDAEGVAVIRLVPGDYTFTLAVPVGYTATSNTLELTAEKTSGSFTVTEIVITQTTYTVTVTDEAGNPLSGATVIIGDMMDVTDETGKVALKMDTATYSASILPPEGYEEPEALELTGDAPNATVALKAVAVPVPPTTYSITVTDKNGTPLSLVTVQFKKNGTVVGTGETNAVGKVALELEADTYEVHVIAPQGYETPAVTEVTAASPLKNVTLKALPAPKVSYTVTVVDRDGQPQSGVTVQFKQNGTVAGTASTDAAGKVTLELESGTYQVAITAPEGYEPPAVVELTADAPQATVALTLIAVIPDPKIPYTVTVVDEGGRALSGVAVQFRKNGAILSSATTDAAGQVTVELEADTYQVTVTTPQGFVSHAGITLTDTAPTGTVTLKAIPKVDYSITVVDENGTPLAAVTVQFKKDGVLVGTATTDAVGKVVLKLESGTYQASVVAPEGYETPASVQLTEATPQKRVTLVALPAPKVTYTVTVVDENGKPQRVMVQIKKGSTVVGKKMTDSSGEVSVELEADDYTVALVFTGAKKYYDTNAATLSATSNNLRITVANKLLGQPVSFYLGNYYNIEPGASYVELVADAPNYFCFSPTESGLYQISTSHSSAVISYWNSPFFASDLTSTLNPSNNSFTFNVNEGRLGADYLLSVTGASSCVLFITRIGDYIPDLYDLPWSEEWMQDGDPTPFSLTIPAGQKIIGIDITAPTSTYKLVYNSADGFYHLNTVDGPVLLMRLGGSAPDLSLATVLGTSAIRKYFYNENGEFIKKEDYTSRLSAYVENMDSKTGTYPVTRDMMYILQQYGEAAGWWDGTANSLLGGYAGLNTEIAWMYACCYVG